jgi:hypothetical protein
LEKTENDMNLLKYFSDRYYAILIPSILLSIAFTLVAGLYLLPYLKKTERKNLNKTK